MGADSLRGSAKVAGDSHDLHCIRDLALSPLTPHISVFSPGWDLRAECLDSNSTSTTYQPGENFHFSEPPPLRL